MTDTAHQWHQGDPEPPVGTSVVRADGVRTTRRNLGWFPGPFNWLGIVSLGPATDDTDAPTARVEVVDRSDPEAVARWRAGAVAQ